MYIKDNSLKGNLKKKKLVNWNILVTNRKEIKKDFVSSGEWKQKKKIVNPFFYLKNWIGWKSLA